MRIRAVTARPLTARFADLYGGAAAIPASVLRPASHFTGIPRIGQYSTLVSVTDEDGLVGHGEAWGLPLPEATAIWIDRLIAPFAVGRDADDVEGIQSELTSYFARIGHTASVALEAISGLDLALWDLRGKRAGRSVAELLGQHRSSVDCYVSPIAFADDEAETRASARAYLDEGFRAVKMKAGRGVERDLADAAAVRDEIGPDVLLLIDCNGAYDLAGATRLAEGLGALRVHWLEEPMPPAAIGDYPDLRRRSPVQLALGENEFTPDQFARILDAGVDTVMPNITRAGGLTGCRAIAAMAKARGAGFSLHGVGAGLMQRASLALLSSLEVAGLFEVNRFPNPLRDLLVAPALVPVDGRYPVPSEPGLGGAIEVTALARFSPPT